MLEARIIASRESLYYAAEVTPYDLETLRQHLREFRAKSGDGVTLELTIEDAPGDGIVAPWARAMSAAGFRVRVLRSHRNAQAA